MMRTAFTVLLVFLALGMPMFAESPPLPEKLLTAKTIYLVNDKAPNKVFDQVYTELKKWGRFEIVADREKADLTVTVSFEIFNVAMLLAGRETVLSIATLDGEPVFTETTNGGPGRVVKNLKNKVEKAEKAKRRPVQ